MPISQNITSTIGRTPLIKLLRIAVGLPAMIALKAEFFNPLGSVKDRIGRAMIEHTESQGLIALREHRHWAHLHRRGQVYKLTLTMPESMSLTVTEILNHYQRLIAHGGDL